MSQHASRAVRYLGAKNAFQALDASSAATSSTSQTVFNLRPEPTQPGLNRALSDKAGDGTADEADQQSSRASSKAAVASPAMAARPWPGNQLHYGTVANMRVLPSYPRPAQPTTLLDPWLPQREQALFEQALWSGAVTEARLPPAVANPPPRPPHDVSSLSVLALPEHLLDSDSEGPTTPRPPPEPVSPPPPSPAAAAADLPEAFRLPFWASGPRGSALSHDAKPFTPQAPVRLFDAMLTAEICSAIELHAAVRHAASPAILFSLIAKHERLLDGCCIVAAMQRLQMLDPQLAPASEFRAVGNTLLAQATKHRHSMQPDQLISVLAGARTLGLPHSDVMRKLAAAAAGHAGDASLDSLASLATIYAHALEHGAAPDSDLDAFAAVANALCARLNSLAPEEGALLPAHMLPAMARALHTAKAAPPATLRALEHATLLQLPALTAAEVVAMMSFFSDAKHAHAALFEALARAFSDKQAQWTPDCVIAYLGLCRTHKHCERASRPLGTLWAALSFLKPHVAACDTRQLSTVVLDMAFIGIRGHDVLAAISAELTARLEAGAVSTAHGPQLANVLHALNKLGHRSDALSSVASGVLATSNLQARQMANVVATLAQQNVLSPAIVAAASDLLQHRLHTCNGQDVSQILYGLMLDKHAARGENNVFAAIAQPLALALRSGAYDARAVSRIMSSYAKVGCYSPVVFDAGTKYLASNMGSLQPAFLSELAWSLSVAEHAQPEVMKRIGSTMMRRFQDCNATMLCTTIWAFAHAGQFHADLFNASCGKLAHLVGRDQVNQQDVVQAMYGVSRSNFRHHRFLQAVHDWALRWHPQIPITTLPSVLWGLATLGHSSERLIQEAAPRFIAQLHSFSSQDSAKLAQLAATYAASPRAQQHVELLQGIEHRLTQPSSRPVHFSAADVSLLAASFGSVRCGASDKLISMLVGCGLEHMADFTPSQLAGYAHGMAQIGYCSDELMNSIARVALAALPQTPIPDLCKVLCAFVEVQASAPVLFDSAAQLVMGKAGGGEISAAEAAQLAWAFALHGTQFEQIIAFLSAVIQDEMLSRNDEMYHLRRPGRALCQKELVQLHQVQTLLQVVGRGGHAAQLMDEKTLADSSCAFQEMVTELRRSHIATGGRRALQVTRDVLRDISRRVTTSPPPAVAAVLGTQSGALSMVDFWAEGRLGEMAAVVLLSPGHCMQAMRERPLGWVACMLAVLQRCVPRVAVVNFNLLSSLDHDSVFRQIQPQLQPQLAPA